MSVKPATSASFDEAVKSGKPVFLKFFAEWCPPCRRMAPLVHDLAEKHPNAIFLEFNADTRGDPLPSRFGVSGIPHAILFDRKGEKATEQVGLNPAWIKRVDEMLTEMGA